MNARLLSQVLLLRYTLSDFLSWSNYLTCQLWYCSVGLHTRLQRWQTWGDNLIDNVILRSLQWDGNLAGLQNPLVPHCLMILKMDIYWNITFICNTVVATRSTSYHIVIFKWYDYKLTKSCLILYCRRIAANFCGCSEKKHIILLV